MFLIYLTDSKISSNQEVLKLVKELRGESLGLIGAAAVLGLIVLLFSVGEGFIYNIPNSGWGLNRPNPFQPPTVEHSSSLWFIISRKNVADSSGGFLMMTKMNPRSSREELTQLSIDVIPTQPQMSGFVENGKVNLHKRLDEVNRKTSEIGCTDFECSLERFKVLATKNGELTNTTAWEAIIILQGRM